MIVVVQYIDKQRANKEIKKYRTLQGELIKLIEEVANTQVTELEAKYKSFIEYIDKVMGKIKDTGVDQVEPDLLESFR